MTVLLSHCYLCDVVGPDLIYSFLGVLTKRFKERDIMLMYSLLQACGLRLRSQDPVATKDFVIAVHERAGQAGVFTHVSHSRIRFLVWISRRVHLNVDGCTICNNCQHQLNHPFLSFHIELCRWRCRIFGYCKRIAPVEIRLFQAFESTASFVLLVGTLSMQGELMLDLVLDIKNNKKKAKDQMATFKYLSDGTGKWLQEAGVSQIKMGELSWQKLLQTDKKGADF